MAPPKPIENEVFTISDDESTNDQPPVKIPKIEEEQVPPPLSPAEEVEYLRKRVAALEKKEGDLQQRLKDAVHAAAAYKTEKENMESLLDSKRGILDGSNQGQNNNLQKRLKEVNRDLANARDQLNESFSKENKTAKENDELKNDKIDLKEDLDFAERQKKRLKAENDALKKELEEMKKKAEDANNVAISQANADFTGRSHLDIKKEEGGNPNDELVRENNKMKEELIEAKRREETANNEKNVLAQEVVALKAKLDEEKKDADEKSVPDRRREKRLYDRILRNYYSAGLRYLPSLYDLLSSLPSVDPQVAKLNKARSEKVTSNVFKLVTTGKFTAGEYITELRGSVSLQEECTNRDPLPGTLNDHTFLLEKELFGNNNDIGNMIIDARKYGNVARYMRRSCKPNAELAATMTGSKLCDLHFMIKAKEDVKSVNEITIKLEDDWKAKPKPAQGCGCEDKQTCEMEKYFNQTSQSVASSSKSDESSN